MTRVSAEGARRGWGRETGSESGLWAGAGGLWERAGKGACSAWRRKGMHRRSEGAMAMAPWRTPGRRVHSEPTRRPIVRSAALKGAEAERWLQRSLLRSTIQWTRAWPSLLLAGGKRAPFSAGCKEAAGSGAAALVTGSRRWPEHGPRLPAASLVVNLPIYFSSGDDRRMQRARATTAQAPNER